MSNKPRIINTIAGPFIENRPEGMCPWGEARCDDKCQPFANCVLYRNRDSLVLDQNIYHIPKMKDEDE